MNETMTRILLKEEYDTKTIWKTYGYWAFWVGIAFFSVYPFCNWLSAQRANVYHLYLNTELSIPFVPDFIWPYMSLYLLFILPPFFLGVSQLELLGKRIILGTLISGGIFLLFPSQLGFERVIPNGFYGEIFTNIFSLDLPHNMAPSLHVVYSAFILLAVLESSSKKSVRMIMLLWLLLIMISTLLVHQHHILDIVSAMVIMFLVTSTFIKGEKNV
jgi:membrane-associated phospholipid phosphatase